MAQASVLDTPVDWLIRSAHNRKLVGGQKKLWDGFAEVHVLGEVRFYLPARKGSRRAKSCSRCRPGAVRCEYPMGSLLRSLRYWHRRQVVHPMASSQSSGDC